MKEGKSNSSPEQEHFVVAVGASAGGLEAIHEFFDNMPSNGHFSFVIVQHLSPDYKSLLVELVAKHTNMKVVEAEHNVPLEKDYVYVIPNNKLLTLANHRLQLSEKNFEKAPNTAIDTFLVSLAKDQGTKAIAVILSGTGTDGTRGISAIHDAGGLVLVQDPISAKFDGMPNSAINSGYVDYILAPELMPEEIFNYIKERPVRVTVEGRPDETLLPEVLKLVEKNCQHDFHNYKTPTILRRIARRMNQLGYKNFTDYIKFLRVSSEECKILGKEFLIGVTKFFRDRAAFDLLRDEVLPEMIRSKTDGDIIKVWVTACSTGEEAYSIAILVQELVEKSGKDIEVKIFATDIDMEAIEFASKGIYPAANVGEIDTALQKKYFSRQGSKVAVNADLRKLIVFARHNILKDPPFIKNDLVSCRNMLIYMNSVLQRKVLSTLQFSLNTGGCLFLGPSEIPASVRDGFEEINGKWKLFRKVSSDNRYNPDRFPASQISKTHIKKYEKRSTGGGSLKVLGEDFKEILTEEYGFAAVYVDRNLEVREAVGDFKKYLSLPDRLSSLQILKMVSPDLSVALNAAIRKASKENTKVVLKTVRIKKDGDEKPVNVFVRPSSQEGYTLVVFGESHELPFTKPVSEFTPQNSEEAIGYISELEEELKETRTSLQLTVESLETANEELQSSNEELLSANEELQSGNEELQSLNEELHTLNTEHQLRIKELIELNDDLNNYFRSSEVAQIFVDNDLKIRKFNPTALKMVNLIEADIGRPIDHISTNLRNRSLVQDIEAVIKTDGIIEKEVELNSGRISLMRILPYLRQDNQTDGVVVTFIDVTKVKELDNIIKAVFNTSLSAIMAFRAVKDDRGELVDFNCIAANSQADKLMGKPLDDYLGKSLKQQMPELMNASMFSKAVHIVRTGNPIRTEVQLHSGGGSHWYELAANKMGEGLVLTLTNIDEKRRGEEKFRQNYQELIRVKENYRNLNIELEEKVKERTMEFSQSEERFRLIANAASDAIWDWNLVANKIWWSESFYSRFGFERSEETSAGDFWIEQIHPDDRQRIRDGLNEAIEKGGSWSAKCRLKKNDGTYASILNRGTVLQDENGVPYRMVGAMMDITEAELADQRLKDKNKELQTVLEEFRFVTNFIPQIVWATQPDGGHDYYNKQWFDYTGLDFQQSKGDGWKHVVHADDQPKAWKIWRQALKTGAPYEIEYRLRRHDGEYRWFLARALPLRDDGKIVKWFGTCTDIHDQRLANEILEQKVKERTIELQKANTDLEASNTELLQFASVASHDLKEPLRKIHIFGNLIKDRYLSNTDGATAYMERIITATARMTKLINDLLTFTRLSNVTTFENVSLNRMVDEVMSDLELAISEKHAIIEVDDLPKVDVITGQIRQVFQNLISNALKFARKDERPRIKITYERVNRCAIDAETDENGDFCRIVIRDNGIGFNNDYAEKIFTIFQRLHSKEQYEGTGIGLAITRKIIEKHNGVIAADGAENQGAEFTIVLPLKQDVNIQIEMSDN